MSRDRIYNILDLSEVRFRQILIFFGSVMIFLLYASALIYYGAVFFGLLLYIVYVSTQIPIGLLLTRYYQELGVHTKKRLKLLDPVNANSNWDMSSQEMQSEELSHIFDEISIELEKHNPPVDDVIDLTWFGVIVWAVLSTGILAVFSPPYLFYASPALVVAGLCLASLHNGYRIAPSPPFDEVMEHLRYLVLSRLLALHSVVGKRYFQPGVKLLCKGRKQIIYDFYALILNKSRSKGAVLTYWLGLSSADSERIEFDVEDELVGAIQDSLELHPLISDSGWKFHVAHDNFEPRVVLRNEQSDLRIDVQSIMVHSPSRIKDTSDKLADALKTVLHELDR